MTAVPDVVEVRPYGVFDAGDGPRVGVRDGDEVLDVSAASPLLQGGSLDRLLAAGPDGWKRTHDLIAAWDGPRHAVRDVALRLPFTVADLTDFFSSVHHATRVGELFRPGSPPLPRAWKHLPQGYHGRSATVVVSGTPLVRPCGQTADGFGPSTRLDLEAELGLVVGVPGTRVPLGAFDRHVFGVCVLNDWSARDVQAYETVPLGPFLGKAFATTVSPWVVPLAALSAARVPPPERDVPLLPHLDDTGLAPWGLDVTLEVRVGGHVLSHPPARTTWWTGAQQLTHLTSGGAAVRTGDLLGTGTVSGPGDDERGCLLELTWDGRRPLALPGRALTWLEDGDEVVLSATAPAPGGGVLDLGEVRAVVQPAVLP